ncbi:MAG: mechanosensitive ion channel [Bacteroides sp.]|nr:mechanosensitive ion channel [Bacteroides sp.]MDD2645001.1 mechanosensitive ion channel [Bacteroides sp.]MDD4054797.1 mechanosensitive ion channel [Bacteroides sp.]MDD4719328.1 mechanosensitive ion channel [Bacteroides sp.]
MNYYTLLLLTSKIVEQTGEVLEQQPQVLKRLIELSIEFGERLLLATIVFVIGRFLISIINKLVRNFLERRKLEIEVKSFLKSLVNITLITLLIVSIVSVLGLPTSSFAALIASAGVAIGMALSGNLQNFAGGIIILVFKPFNIDDFVECQGVSGTVEEIQIFHTIIRTPDNKVVYVPNGALSSGVITNLHRKPTRRVQWVIGVDYGTDYNLAQEVIQTILDTDKRILKDPATAIVLHELDSSSVNIRVRAWVKREDYWGVYFDINQAVYKVFNEKGIEFPFPQLTVHQAEN